jgi:hypothetical protein
MLDPYPEPSNVTHPGSPLDLTKEHSLAIIDTTLAKDQSFTTALQADHVIVLDAQTNGITQVTEALQKFQNLSSIQFFTHGSAGQLQLGNTHLDNANLAIYRHDLQQWSNALSNQADLLFYGCNVGARERGANFVKAIQALTQADIQASNDLTGQEGDWDLEVQAGMIEATPVLSGPTIPSIQQTLHLSDNPHAEASADRTIIGETGVVEGLQDEWQTVTLQHNYVNPVVIAGPPSHKGKQPAIVRVRNFTSNSFEIQIDEWDYQDGRHAKEDVGFLVVEAGTHILENGATLVAGNQTQVNNQWKTIDFGTTFDAAPVVLAQTSSVNILGEGTALTERVQQVSDRSFALKLQEQEAADQVFADERVSWVAISQGNGSLGDVNYTALTSEISSTPSQQTFGRDIAGTPVLLASSNSARESDPMALRYSGLNRTQATLQLQEEKSQDQEIIHGNEVVGIFALGAGLLTTAATTTDTEGPQASLAAVDLTTGGTTPYDFAVTYSDPAGVDIATLDSTDIVVTGPGSNPIAAEFVRVNDSTNGSPRTATYRLAAPGGAWDIADNGTYTFEWAANQVADQLGNTRSTPTALGSIEVNIPDTPGPADLLPDIFPIAETTNNTYYLDTSTQSGRALLRFATEAANIGNGPLEIWGGNNNGADQSVFQRIYREDGSTRDRLAGSFEFHPTHGHIHFEGFATYNLREVNGDGSVGDIVASGGKTSFCLINLRHPFPELTQQAQIADGRGGGSCGQIQGISVGYSDVYAASLPDQWIDVTNVGSGSYWLEVISDPDNNLVEADESNNIARVQINFNNPLV